MRPRAVVVAHREAMVGEGIAAALDRYPGIASIAVTTLRGRRDRTRRSRPTPSRSMLVSSGRIGRHDCCDVEECGSCSSARTKARKVVSVCLSARASPTLPSRSCPRSFHRVHPTERLTAREREVLRLVAEGFAAKQVARHLGSARRRSNGTRPASTRSSGLRTRLRRFTSRSPAAEEGPAHGHRRVSDRSPSPLAGRGGRRRARRGRGLGDDDRRSASAPRRSRTTRRRSS